VLSSYYLITKYTNPVKPFIVATLLLVNLHNFYFTHFQITVAAAAATTTTTANNNTVYAHGRLE